MIADIAIRRASEWCYQGVWAVVTNWLHVPAAPPELAGADDRRIKAFRPAPGYLSYRKLFFWIGLAVVDLALLTLWIVILASNPLVGMILAVPFWFVIIAPDVLVYIGLHLRYDTTWYVLSDRTMRIRRGIWVINEITITYENIQNVSVRQGPVQRLFGISDVIVQTAGGGGTVGPHGEQKLGGHIGVMEGVDNPEEIRELVIRKWRSARTTGLGDEPLVTDRSADQLVLSTSELALLKQIRAAAVRLADGASL